MPPDIVLLSSDDDDDDDATRVSPPPSQRPPRAQSHSRPRSLSRPDASSRSTPMLAHAGVKETITISDDDNDNDHDHDNGHANDGDRDRAMPAALTASDHALPSRTRHGPPHIPARGHAAARAAFAPALDTRVCMGMTKLPFSTPVGVPPQLVCGFAGPVEPLSEVLSSWRSTPGSRPAIIARKSEDSVRALLARYSHGIVPPAVLSSAREVSVSLAWPQTAVFGTILDPHAQVLDVLLRDYKVQVEARVPMALAAHANVRLHPGPDRLGARQLTRSRGL